jgi:hypothetical protein
MTIVLESIATLALLYHIKSKKPLSLEYSKSEDDFIEMIDISAVSHVTVNKKPFSHFSPDNEPFKEKKTLLLPSAPIKAVSYTVNVGDLFPESYYVAPAPARRMSYAEAVGYANIVTKPPRHGHAIESYVYLGDLFPEEATNNIQSPPVRKMTVF